jgi:tetratricopeptide (TPR) repeat protein
MAARNCAGESFSGHGMRRAIELITQEYQMSAKIILFPLLSVLLTGCAMAQKGAVSKAGKAYEKNEYQVCLRHLNRAESYGNYSEVVSAQVLFNRGLCLEGAGRTNEAVSVYKVLITNYPNSSLTGQAMARLENAQNSQSPKPI